MSIMEKSGGVYYAETACVIGDATIGEGSSIWFGAVVRADDSSITIGRNVNVQDNAVIHTEPGVPVEIGDNVTIGHGAVIHCRKIGSDSLIGIGAMLLDGAEVGEQCIIGAGALVVERKVIPPGSLVLGMPGKVTRELTEEEKSAVLENAIDYHRLAEKCLRMDGRNAERGK